MKLKHLTCYTTFVFLALLISNSFTQSLVNMVDITNLDSTIIVELRYATTNNFMKEKLYTSNICLLQRPVAERLIKVHRYLQERGMGLKVWDGYRPLSVQKKMWEKIPDTNYVANPNNGSKHNRGAAVDITLVDAQGNELEMPTAFDDFSEKARVENMALSHKAIMNRSLLHEAMKRFGFLPIKSEWWHFNDPEAKKYSVMDIPLDYFETHLPQKSEARKEK